MSDILGYNGAPLALNGAPITCNTAGTDTSGGTITSAAQILYPYIGFSQGVRYVGNIQSQAAQTIYPSTSDQTISSGQYLSGTQTIKGVTVSNLTAANIKSGVTIEIGDAVDSDRIMSVTGSFSGGTLAYASITPSSTSKTLTVSILGTPKLFYLLSLYEISNNNVICSAGGPTNYCYGWYYYNSALRIDDITVTSTSDSITLNTTTAYFLSNNEYYLFYIY